MLKDSKNVVLPPNEPATLFGTYDKLRKKTQLITLIQLNIPLVGSQYKTGVSRASGTEKVSLVQQRK